jgi:hypothetical protein
MFINIFRYTYLVILNPLKKIFCLKHHEYKKAEIKQKLKIIRFLIILGKKISIVKYNIYAKKILLLKVRYER